MSILGKRVIYVGPADGSNGKPLKVEGLAKAAILPGAPVSLAADSTGLEVATALDNLLLVADKDQLRSKSVDDAWTIAETMVAIQPRSGEFVNVLVETAQALVRGTPLTMGTTGLTTGTEANAVCYADEIVTTAALELVCVRVA